MTPYGVFKACYIEQFSTLIQRHANLLRDREKTNLLIFFFLNNAKSNKNIQKSKSQKKLINWFDKKEKRAAALGCRKNLHTSCPVRSKDTWFKMEIF